MKCLGKNKKGVPCTFKPTINDDYCKIHQSYKKMIEITTIEKKNYVIIGFVDVGIYYMMIMQDV